MMYVGKVVVVRLKMNYKLLFLDRLACFKASGGMDFKKFKTFNLVVLGSKGENSSIKPLFLSEICSLPNAFSSFPTEKTKMVKVGGVLIGGLG
jgi:hypothetical protein